MIVVKVELWPYGSEDMARTLGTAKIANDGTGSQDCGNYVAELYKESLDARPWKRVKVKGFARLQNSVWELLYLVLVKGFVDERRDP